MEIGSFWGVVLIVVGAVAAMIVAPENLSGNGLIVRPYDAKPLFCIDHLTLLRCWQR